MNKKNILIIMGHPNRDSLCSALAEKYYQSSIENGHNVKILRLIDLQFNPNLLGHSTVSDFQNLELDIQQSIESVITSDHIVFVFPSWWASMPAILKGWIDRVFLPGYTFRYRKDSPFPEKLLKNKTARLFVTMDAPPWYYRIWNFSPGVQIVKKGTLEFCGVGPVKVTLFGEVRTSTLQKRNTWLEKVSQLGKDGK